MTVLITGGAGYIGSHINKLLSAKGRRTVVYDNLVTGHAENARWGKFVQADVCDREKLIAVMREEKVTCVMHFAAFIEVGESMRDPDKYYRNNLTGILSVLSAMKETGVKNLVFSSTCATYGVPQSVPIAETHPQAPINVYGRTKLMAEKMMADYSSAYGMTYAALRYFNAAGADPDLEIGEWHTPETHLIPNVLAAAANGTSVNVFGGNYPTPDGTCVRDYIHVNDIAQAHLLAADYLAAGGASECFNLGNGKGFSVKQVIAAAEAITGKKVSVINAEPRPGDPPRLVGDAAKARRVLGWKPEFADISPIVSTAWNWYGKLHGLKGA